MRIDVLEQIGTSAFDRNKTYYALVSGAAKRAAQPHGAAVPLELNVGSVAAGPARNRFSWPFLGSLAKLPSTRVPPE
jgi:hypothetical protein